tara:strand:+ start:8923 stop:10224 length:1302 start_codon:yes stop_codon:yes gene_type:complete
MINQYGISGVLEGVNTLKNFLPKDSILFYGRVTDIILNSSHPQFNTYGGWNGLGTIVFEPLTTSENNVNIPISIGDKSQSQIATSFFPQLSVFPLINEIVTIMKGPSNNLDEKQPTVNYYYFSPLSIWNHPHQNALPNPIPSNNLPSYQQKDYQQTQAGSVRRVTDKSTEIDLNSPLNPSQNTFPDGDSEIVNIHPLLPFAGDIMYQGRWGNSIRFGSTAKPTNSSALNNWSSTGKNGDPITIIRNGQPTDVSPQGWIPITEKINNDLASIYQTSTQKIPIQVASENYNSYKTPPEIPSQYTKPQVIINSDRLVFNAKTDSVLLSAEKSVGLSSNDSLNFNSKNYIVAAGSIKLGSKDATEPLVKGETLYKNLTQVVNALITLVDVMEVQQLWPGGVATPDGATSVTARATKDILNNVKKDLVNIKSKVSKTV